MALLNSSQPPKMSKPLAVVTGASSGIGREFAKLLAQEGFDLVIVARDQTGLDRVATEIQKNTSSKVHTMSIDLSASNAADKLWAKIPSTPQILINNAGIGDYAQVVDADPIKIRLMLDLNVQTLTRLAQLAAIDMKRSGGGNILNLASTAAFLPGAGMAAYYASKAYVLSFSEALSEELRSTNVFVTALCPGPTNTQFQKTAHAERNGVFNRKLPTPQAVALFGYTALKKKKVIAVHGFSNKVFTFLPRLLPRATIRKLVANAQGN